MKRILIGSAFLVTIATPALAQEAGTVDQITPGQRQLAASLGVDPGEYTLFELAEMRAAISNDDRMRLEAIRGGRDVAVSRSAASPAAEQLGGSLGVESGDHTMSELSGMFLDAYD